MRGERVRQGGLGRPSQVSEKREDTVIHTSIPRERAPRIRAKEARQHKTREGGGVNTTEEESLALTLWLHVGRTTNVAPEEFGASNWACDKSRSIEEREHRC